MDDDVLTRLQDLLDELIDETSNNALEFARRGDALLAELETIIETGNVCDRDVLEDQIYRLRDRIETLENELSDRDDDIIVLEQEIERLQEGDEEE